MSDIKLDLTDDREIRAFALSTAAAVHNAPHVRLGGDEATTAAVILADAKAFEAFIRTGRIPASHRVKPVAIASEANDG